MLDFVDAICADSPNAPNPTWSEVEAALREYCGCEEQDVDSIRDALRRCTRRPDWKNGRFRAALEGIARDFKGASDTRRLLVKDAFIDGQTDPILKAFLVKHRKDSNAELSKKPPSSRRQHAQ